MTVDIIQYNCKRLQAIMSERFPDIELQYHLNHMIDSVTFDNMINGEIVSFTVSSSNLLNRMGFVIDDYTKFLNEKLLKKV